MDDAEVLLSYLYTHPPAGVPRKKVEGAWSDYQIARERGEKTTFSQIVVRKGILPKGLPEKILASERKDYAKSSIADDKKKPPPPKTPSAPKVPVAKKPPKKPDYSKQAVPALLISLLLGALIWRVWPQKAPPPPPRQASLRTEPWDPFAENKASKEPTVDTTLDLRRSLIDLAKTGDPEEAEGKLDEAIKKASDPEEKKRLEQLRWELHFVKKERVRAQKAIDEARRRLAAGDREGAARALEGLEAPEGTPENAALKKASEGEGEIGSKLKPAHKGESGASSETPRENRGPWRPSTKKRDLPPPRSEPQGSEMPPPIPPPQEGGEEGPIPGGEVNFTNKPKSSRKHGQRPRGESRGRDLVTSFVDEVDENPDDDAPPVRPEEAAKGEVVAIKAEAPLEVEPQRAEEIGRITSEGVVYLERVREWLKSEREYRDGAIEREARRVADATSQTERFLRQIEIPGGLTLRDARVVQYTAKGFALKDSHATWGSDWKNNKDIALDVRRLAVDPGEPRDWMRFGRWAARTRYFDEAKKAFRRAREGDPSLARRIPDVDLLEKIGSAFAGTLARAGDSIRITWGFRSPLELEDFRRSGGVSLGHGRLLLDAREKEPAKAMLGTPILSTGRASVEARIDQEPGVLVIGFLIQGADADPPPPRAIYFRYEPASGQALLMDGTALLAVGAGGAGARIVHLEVGRDAIEARVGLFYARVPCIMPPSFNLVPIVASAAGSVSVAQLSVATRADRGWLEKVLGDTEFRVALLLEETIGAPPFAYAHASPQLSAEIAYLATDVTPEILSVYKKAKPRCAKGGADALLAVGEMRWITEEAPDFAPAQYWVARYAFEIDHPGFALGCLNQAITSAGGFAEALALRSRVLARLRRFDEADADMKKALEWRPDMALVHEEAAWLALDEQQLERARSELEIAFALEPMRSREVEEVLSWVTHVIEGPPWEKPTHVETEHYVWTSSLKTDRVKQFAGALEGMRPAYFASLGVKAREEKRKSMVLLFDSQASFVDYNAVARHYGAQNAAGFFVPLTKELELFEQENDPSGEGTSSTLFHEGFHQFFDRIIDTKNIPYWANEGLGDYFGTTGVLKNWGKPGRKQRGRLADLFSLGAIPIDDLMNDDALDFRDHAFQRYAQSWTVVHYLMEGEGGRLKPLLVAYLEHLRAGRSPVNAYNRTFGRIDMDEFERGWAKHVVRLRDETR